MAWHAQALGCAPHVIGLTEPRQHMMAFEGIGHDQITLLEMTPAHDASRMRANRNTVA
jgi:hypothetical protein